MQVSSRSGFSLVEVAVVLAIIGLLTGGVVVGQKVVETARLNRIINDTQRFKQAVVQFEERYGALPGDVTNATALFPSASPAAVNGNGDRILNSSGVGATGNEDLHFWRHLKLAGLLDVGKFDGSSRFQPGDGVPLARSDNNTGYKARSDTLRGLYFELSAFSLAGTGSDALPALTAAQALALDKKFDDGDPATGVIRGIGAACLGGGGYNTAAGGDLACQLQIIAGQTLATAAAPGGIASCGGQPLGATRPSPGLECPQGTSGTVVDVCLASGWQTRYQCEIGRCLSENGPAYINDRRSVHCKTNIGTREEQCRMVESPPGVFTPTWVPTSSCCMQRNKACPAGETGVVGITEERCPPGAWTEISSDCIPIAIAQCTDTDGTLKDIGQTRNVFYPSCASGWPGTKQQRCEDISGTPTWVDNGVVNCSCLDTAHPGSPWPPGYASTAGACVANVSTGILTFTCQSDGKWKASGTCCQLLRRQIQGGCPAGQKQMQISNHLGGWTSYGGCIAKNPGPATTCIDAGNSWWETSSQCRPLGDAPTCNAMAPDFSHPSAAIFTPLESYP